MPRLRLVMVLLALATASISAQQLLPVPRATTELLTNGGFEADFDGWTGKGIDLVKSDKVKCDKPEKLVAHTGICAFMFRGNADGSSSKIQQTLADTSALVNGATVTFSVYLDVRSGAVGATIGKAKVIYSDDTKTKFSLTIPALRSRGVEDYQQISDTQTISLGDGVTITKAKVDFRYKAAAGKFLIDDASFAIISDDPTPTATNTAVATDSATATPTAANTLTPTSTTEATSTATNTPVPNPVKLVANDGTSLDSFGSAVAISGNTAVIGAYRDNEQGAAYVFTRSGGVWTQQQKLTASDGETDDQFGWSVGIDGDTIVVGTWKETGAAYVFVYNGSTWVEQQKLTASDGESHDGFGRSVAISGDTVGVGAAYEDELGNSAGAVYIFTRNADTWTEQQKLTASDGEPINQFGISLAINGDTLVAGAWHQSDTPAQPGAAYVFTRSGGLWTEQQKIAASDAQNGDNFGWTAALTQDTILVSAASDSITGIAPGSAYIFTQSGGSWIQQQKLTASDGQLFDNFGVSAALHGEVAVIGAHRDDDGRGAAYVFRRNGTVWAEDQKLTASDGEEEDLFGVYVAIEGTTVFSTAPFDDIGSNLDQGSAWVFELP